MKRRLMLTLAAAFLFPGMVMAASSDSLADSLADALQPKASLLKIIFGIGRDDHHRGYQRGHQRPSHGGNSGVFGHHPGHHPGHPGSNPGSGNWGHGNGNTNGNNGGIAHGYPGNTGNGGNGGNNQNGNGSWGQGGHGGHGGHPGNNGNSSGYPTQPGYPTNGGYNNGGYNNGGYNNGNNGGYNNGGYNNGGHHNHPAPAISPQLRQSIQRVNFSFQQAISSVTPYMGHRERAAYAQALRNLSQELNFQNSLLPYRYQAEISTIQRRIEDARFSLLSAYDARTAHATVLRAQARYQGLIDRVTRGY